MLGAVGRQFDRQQQRLEVSVSPLCICCDRGHGVFARMRRVGEKPSLYEVPVSLTCMQAVAGH
jgi:hypothetical protein